MRGRELGRALVKRALGGARTPLASFATTTRDGYGDRASEPSTSSSFERLTCETRAGTGKGIAGRTRREGRVPAVLFRPGSVEKTLLTASERELNAAVRRHTLAGTQCEVFELEVTDGDGTPRIVRALAKQVHMHAYNKSVENVCFLEVEPETEVRVRVRVETLGEDVSPGVKRGGFVQILRKTVPVKCRSDSIPKKFTVDVSALDAGKIIRIRDVKVAEGIKLLDANLDLPLIIIAGKVKSAA